MKKKSIKFGCDGLTFDKELTLEYVNNGLVLPVDFALPGKCLNSCVYCGYYQVNTEGKLKTDEIKNIIGQLSELKAKSLRIVGEGEPFLRKDILELLEYAHSRGIKSVVFSCGDVLGNDELAKKIHGISGEQIIGKLKELGVTIILKYEKEFQDDISGRQGYSAMRNTALARLIKAGFNRESPTRLAFGTVMTRYNKEYIPKVYEFALRQNIFPLLCPLMPIGKMRDKKERDKVKLNAEEVNEIAVELHKINHRFGIPYRGPSDFPGTIPCFIAKFGMYLTDVGDIYPCVAEEKIGNTREMQLKDAWEMLKEYKKSHWPEMRSRGQCYMKRKMGIIPADYGEVIDSRVKEYLAKNRGEFNTARKEKLGGQDWDYLAEPTIFHC
ncbi:MAG: radical SAM protein [Candidatus Diapherotrites archaeon]